MQNPCINVVKEKDFQKYSLFFQSNPIWLFTCIILCDYEMTNVKFQKEMTPKL